jgi:hypothetical protein
MRASTRLTRTVILAALAVAGLAASASPASAADYQASRLTAFNWVQGQTQWAAPSQSRLARSQWRFSPNGYFAMAQPDGYPLLQGSWTRRGSTTSFHGQYVFSTGYSGQTVTDVVGTLRGQRLSLRYYAGQTLAAVVGCDVNGNGCARYGSSRSKVFTASVLLTRFA